MVYQLIGCPDHAFHDLIEWKFDIANIKGRVMVDRFRIGGSVCIFNKGNNRFLKVGGSDISNQTQIFIRDFPNSRNLFI